MSLETLNLKITNLNVEQVVIQHEMAVHWQHLLLSEKTLGKSYSFIQELIG